MSWISVNASVFRSLRVAKGSIDDIDVFCWGVSRGFSPQNSLEISNPNFQSSWLPFISKLKCWAISFQWITRFRFQVSKKGRIHTPGFTGRFTFRRAAWPEAIQPPSGQCGESWSRWKYWIFSLQPTFLCEARKVPWPWPVALFYDGNWRAWKAKCPILKAIVAGFGCKVASRNRTLGVPGGTVTPKPAMRCRCDIVRKI